MKNNINVEAVLGRIIQAMKKEGIEKEKIQKIFLKWMELEENMDDNEAQVYYFELSEKE